VDNSWFTLLTQNVNPIHFDRAYAAQTEFGQPLVDSTFTLALVFLTAFALYYFINWKYLSQVWGLS